MLVFIDEAMESWISKGKFDDLKHIISFNKIFKKKFFT
jgi:hypothetical protein